MNKIAVFLIIILSINLLSGFCIADEVTVKSVSPSPYYDSQPKVWGNYVVWRRAINQNDNEYIDLNEPSWIMVHNLESGSTWNITPENTVISGNVYYHAQSPDIWDGRVVYEAQTGLNSSDTKLFLHNISSKKTWEIPIMSTEYSHGHLHCIYGNWVAYTNIEGGLRQAYLYNYRDGIYRTILGVSNQNTTYGMVMDAESVVLTVKNQTGMYSIWVYEINTGYIEEVDFSNSKQILATSINNGKISIIVKYNNHADWGSYIYDLDDRIKDLEYDTCGFLVWDKQYVYKSKSTIYFVSGNEGDLPAIISGQNQRLGDIHKNTVVWSDNINSKVMNGDARDDFDIYVRTVITDEEILFEKITIVAVIVIIILVLVIARIKLYSDNEK